jgi:regulator of RNase E activity RraA
MDDLIEAVPSNLSVALLADAAYRCGVAVGVAPAAIEPLDPSRPLAGPVRPVQANNDLVAILAAVHAAAPGEVIVIDNPDLEVGLIGDLIGLEAQRKGLGGFVVDGCVRDRVELVRLGVPVFARGTVPVGPLKIPAERKGIGVLGEPVQVGDARVTAADWAFGDADGVVFLPGNELERIVEAAQQAQDRETALENKMRAGEALGDVLAIEEFLRRRDADPDGADFNAHLARTGRAI